MICTYPFPSTPATHSYGHKILWRPKKKSQKKSWQGILNLPISGNGRNSIIYVQSEWGTISDVAWMVLAWQTGVLEHQPAMLKNKVRSHVCEGSPFLFYHERGTKACTLAHCLGAGGRSNEHLPRRCPQIYASIGIARI